MTLVIGFAVGFGIDFKTSGAAGFLMLKKLKLLFGDARILGFGFAETAGVLEGVDLDSRVFDAGAEGFLIEAAGGFGFDVTVDEIVDFELDGGLVVAGVLVVEVLAAVLDAVAVVLLPVITTVLPTTFEE